jgi:hypothetical protein
MTLLETFNYFQVLSHPALKNIKSFKVNYAIIKNKKLLGIEVDACRELLSKIEGYDDYQKKLAELGEKRNAATDEKEKKKFDGKLETLQKEYKDALSKEKEVFDTASAYAPYTIKASDIPEDLDSISTEILFQLIEE